MASVPTIACLTANKRIALVILEPFYLLKTMLVQRSKNYHKYFTPILIRIM